MKRYISHLLADLETATRNAPVTSTYRFRHPFDMDDEQDAPAYQLRYVRLCELFGLPAGIYPPSERLTRDQITALLTAFETLWRAWNIDWDCPPRLSARRRYTVMVDWMEREPVRYSHEYGTHVNFCEHRSEGACPFGESGTCWCEELDACARRDLEIWESACDLDDPGAKPPSPVDEWQQWLAARNPEMPPWAVDETQNTRQLNPDDEALAWLYFYDPQRGAKMADETPEPLPEDFEDFDWYDSADDDFDELPF